MSKIDVVEYNKEWPKQYIVEKQAIKNVLKDNFVSIHHIGSTSVPNLIAKPKIDIICEVIDPIKSIEQLKEISYQYRGEYNIPMHYGFSKRGDVPEVNLHVYEQGHPEVELNIKFRDYLRNNTKAKEEYIELKQNLINKESSYKKNDSMFSGYNLGKNEFITKAIKASGFDRLRFTICTHYAELEKAIHIIKKSNIAIENNIFNDNNLIGLMLYKGVDIIGYAQVSNINNKQVLSNIILSSKNNGEEVYFIKEINRWIK